MRSRSWLEHSRLGLGAAADAAWCGALAALVTEGSWPVQTAAAWLIVFVAAQLADRGRGSTRLEMSGAQGWLRRVALTVLVVAGAALFVAAGRSWQHPYLLWQVVRDVIYVGALVVLGVRLAMAPPSPDEAVRRAIRCFALVCVLLVCAAVGHATPSWGAGAVVVVLAAGGLSIAVTRYEALVADGEERLHPASWLGTVGGGILCVIVVAALLSRALDLATLRWTLHALLWTVQQGLSGLVYSLGWAAGWVVQGVVRLLAMLHLHKLPPAAPAHASHAGPRHMTGHASHTWSAVRPWLSAALAAAVAGAVLAAVLVAMRRRGGGAGDEDQVDEEREKLTSLGAAARLRAAAAARRVGHRLRALVRREARTPGELVRLRYADLERRLAHNGLPRRTGVTVRDHLAAVTASAMGGEGGAPEDREIEAAREAAVELAAIYELARYSAEAVERAQAERFASLAGEFGR